MEGNLLSRFCSPNKSALDIADDDWYWSNAPCEGAC